MTLTPTQRQSEMLRLYGEIVFQRERWAGKLVLTFGEHSDLVSVPVSLAGGTTLLLTEDAFTAKSALRRGELDFVVYTVDEALRTLKNEIRRARPLGVAAVGELAAMLEELADRGFTPEWIWEGGLPVQQKSCIEASLEQLQCMGSTRTELVLNEEQRAMPLQAQGTRWHAWHVQADSLEQLRVADRDILAILPAEDSVRRQWIERLPRYVRDSVLAGRWVWLTDEEVGALPKTIRISQGERLEFRPTTP